MIDACMSGASGGINGENDMAQAFGMYSDSNMANGDQCYVGWQYDTSGPQHEAYVDYILGLFYAFYPSGMSLGQAEWNAYFSNTSEFEDIYSHNLMNYGGSYNDSSWSTFFEIH